VMKELRMHEKLPKNPGKNIKEAGEQGAAGDAATSGNVSSA
jgi:hypothetical protein